MNRSFSKRFWVSALSFCLAVSSAGCNSSARYSDAPESTQLGLSGSDTMANLARAWGESFTETHPNVLLEIDSEGSGTGFESLTAGTADIAKSSRAITFRENSRLIERRVADPAEFVVAMDRMAVFVSPANPLASLSLSQIEKVFAGTIENWSELGGQDAAINVYIRDRSSGTRIYFRNRFMRSRPYADSSIEVASSSEMSSRISDDPVGIGFGSASSSDGVRVVPVEDASGQPTTPEIEHVLSGRYPLVRPLFLYTVGKPKGLVAEFIEFSTSDIGREIVLEQGFCPPPKK